MASCVHNSWAGVNYPCIACTPDTPESERLRSIGFGFAGGRAEFHDGMTVREQIAEMHENAKKYGNEPPEKVGGYASAGPPISKLG